MSMTRLHHETMTRIRLLTNVHTQTLATITDECRLLPPSTTGWTAVLFAHYLLIYLLINWALI